MNVFWVIDILTGLGMNSETTTITIASFSPCGSTSVHCTHFLSLLLSTFLNPVFILYPCETRGL